MFNKSMNFIRIFKLEFSKLVAMAVWKLTKNTKFQLNSSKIMPARAKKHRNMGVNTTLANLSV